MEAKLVRDDKPPDKFVKHEHTISGLSGYHLEMQRNIPLEESKMCQVQNHASLEKSKMCGPKASVEVQFDGFSVGSVLVLRCVCMCVCVHACMCMHACVRA